MWVENVRFDFFGTVAVKIVDFWNFMPCSLMEIYQRFEESAVTIFIICLLEGQDMFLQNASKISSRRQ